MATATIYGDHIEDQHGHLIPAPMGFHPALAEIRDELLAQEADTHEVALWIGTQLLHFRRGMIAASDVEGGNWLWCIWIDECGRGVGGQAVLVDV